MPAAAIRDSVHFANVVAVPTGLCGLERARKSEDPVLEEEVLSRYALTWRDTSSFGSRVTAQETHPRTWLGRLCFSKLSSGKVILDSSYSGLFARRQSVLDLEFVDSRISVAVFLARVAKSRLSIGNKVDKCVSSLSSGQVELYFGIGGFARNTLLISRITMGCFPTLIPSTGS